MLNGVAQPDDRDFIFLKEAIDPEFVVGCVFRGSGGFLKEVFGFIANDQVWFAFEKREGAAQFRKPPFTRDRVAIAINEAGLKSSAF